MVTWNFRSILNRRSQGDPFSDLVIIEEANILIIVNSFVHSLNIYGAFPMVGHGPRCWAYTVNKIYEVPNNGELVF